ncbi:IgGFc-binding protein-like [Hemicordylus capensis]|uniref:IgGFc-binding protein-like n=1 Tax=Hemicordylus capensis TaxID=884348 RepID=UPI00230375B4|nr:IgGFc-binding protein-like [Hemicordylus capensis]
MQVNGIQTHLPTSLNNGTLQLSQSGTFVILTTDFQLRVMYDWNHHLRVTISSAYYEGVCGLCGNYNDDPRDDFQTPVGTIVPTTIALGESWAVKNEDGACWHDCHGECQPCSPKLAKKYERESYCGLITKLSNGPFNPCHAKVDPTTYFKNCVFDVCINEGQKQSLCGALKAYADVCQSEGAQIGEWRKSAGCPLECPPNSQYELCGTACPATCVNDNTQIFCSAVCVEGCQCNDGFVLSQGKCIPKDSCGCVYDGRRYVVNESFWADDACQKRCICNSAMGGVKCRASACKPSERCQVVNGIRSCYPISYGTCTITGSSHYLTFDKYRFDFHGVCVYVLAEVCRKPPELEEFGIYVQNENWRNYAEPFTWNMQVNAYDFKITVSRQYPGRILVNGLLTYLPYSAAGGRISAYRRAQAAVIQMDFGLTVTFDWRSQVTVTVPSSYAGTLCGVCGNFNGNPADDAPLSLANLVPSKPVFGTYTESLYNEIIDPRCPGLQAITEDQRASGWECGLIVAKDGPFRECHDHVNQEAAFQDCAYDYCYFKGRHAYMCARIASYATACQAAGVTVYAWRSSTFCPPSCPPKSHYELCSKDCGQTCSSLYDPIPCHNKCEEDCICNESFILSSSNCVPVDHACHGIVNPTVHLNNCIFDLCMSNEDNQTLCQNIQSYVIACQEVNVPIQTWRSLDFCWLSVILLKENLSIVASVPGSYMGYLCGLCGNANGDPSDDMAGKFGEIQVTLNPDGGVVVTVTSVLAEKICGACGNFNNNQTDDLKGPDGVELNNLPELLVFWTARDFTHQ